MEIKSNFGGKFRIVAIRPDGTERVLADWFDNLILNIGLDRIGARLTCITHAHVGAGSSPPAVTDLAMAAGIASTSQFQGSRVAGNASAAPYYGWCRQTFRFNAGVAAGDLTEVGVGWGASSTQIFSRALIKNTSGDPITITVLPDEVLDVTYELRLYPPEADVPYSITISGVEYTGVIRPSRVTSSVWQPVMLFAGFAGQPVGVASGTIGSVTQRPSGSIQEVYPNFAAYVNGNFYVDTTSSWGLNMANFGPSGINSVYVSWLGEFQYSLSQPILKDANRILSINARLSWSRYTPS